MQLIAVMTCPGSKFEQRLAASTATWIRRFETRGFRVEIFDGRRLGVSDAYEALPQKIQALFRWALTNGVDRLVKADDDTFFTKGFQFTNYDYAGIVMPPNDYGSRRVGTGDEAAGSHPSSYASGGAYEVSSKVMNIMANEEITDWAEDRWVGNTLANHGISPVELRGWVCLPPRDDIVSFMNMEHAVLTQLNVAENISYADRWLSHWKLA